MIASWKLSDGTRLILTVCQPDDKPTATLRLERPDGPDATIGLGNADVRKLGELLLGAGGFDLGEIERDAEREGAQNETREAAECEACWDAVVAQVVRLNQKTGAA